MLVAILVAIKATTKRTTIVIAVLQHTILAETVAGITTTTVTVTVAKTVAYDSLTARTGATLTLSTRRRSGEGNR
jgi:hypothetical protein